MYDFLPGASRKYHQRCYNVEQTRNIFITFVQRRPSVFDVGPTLYKCYTNVSCLLASFRGRSAIFVSCGSCGAVFLAFQWLLFRYPSIPAPQRYTSGRDPLTFRIPGMSWSELDQIHGPSEFQGCHDLSHTRPIISFHSTRHPHHNALSHTLQPLKRWIDLWKPWRPKDFFKFEIIINVLVSSFWFIWIPVVWVYGH